MAKIGVQAMMLKESFADIGPFETLRKVAEIGYRAVEVSQIPMDGPNVAELERSRGELGIEFAALSAQLDGEAGATPYPLAVDVERAASDCARLGTDMLRIGMLPMSELRSEDRVVDYARRVEKAALALADHGITLYYHNHHVDFAKMGGRYVMDILAEEAPSIGLEVDVHWVQRGGLDPVRTLAKYAGRTAMVHLKDYRIGALPEEGIAAYEAGDSEAFQRHFKDVVQFAEVGEGNLDFAAIVPAAVDAGARYLLVEQDLLYGRTVFEALTTSHDNLVALGFGDLF
ncbi:sugar phosphate isomerase/epimerase [Sinomonas atrocyanea]|jgi:sugar phosphate isomerase/epimerase|uniref:sugar phosphate isomerase/epimerase family protein n=1 Tax=Sinomonas atrocyanea TaxID=37927 RepID=UPI00278AAA75|nr:sugar phosphate isomerase/epimerase [Sinomonas atrocyanea]MDQ0260657.1 sugar phosphate isomerase/epimerase [Sinomonas atrocyanea]MDR6621337.1 sugar phosphate isomerase/epimerase [Sinomonas atrocyanea]